MKAQKKVIINLSVDSQYRLTLVNGTEKTEIFLVDEDNLILTANYLDQFGRTWLMTQDQEEIQFLKCYA